MNQAILKLQRNADAAARASTTRALLINNRREQNKRAIISVSSIERRLTDRRRSPRFVSGGYLRDLAVLHQSDTLSQGHGLDTVVRDVDGGRAVAIPVLICGSTMRVKIRSQPAPDNSAPSSNETGTCRTLAARMSAATGTNRARYAITTIAWEP